jgi:hypothetical protein
VVLVALILPLYLIAAAIAINLAYMQLARAELRIATDASARAAGRTLSLTQSIDDARTAAHDAASRNLVAGQPLQLASTDIEFGINTRPDETSPWSFAANGGVGPVNAVRVLGRKTAPSPSGAVPLFFTQVLGKEIYEPSLDSVAMQVDRDIALVVDRSGSMGGLIDIDTNKWDALVVAVDRFLASLVMTVPEERVALVWFNDQVGSAVDLTNDYTAIRTAMDTLGPGGSTAIGLGLEEGVATILNPLTARPFALKTVVVMTDGIHNTGEAPDLVATREVDSHNLLIHSITFGDGADQTRMQAVAEIGGGRHWHAVDQAELEASYVEIASDIPTILTH